MRASTSRAKVLSLSILRADELSALFAFVLSILYHRSHRGNLSHFQMSQFAMTKVLYLVFISVLVTTLATGAKAQAPVVDWTKWKATPQQLDGTITVVSDGVTSRAEVKYQAPDRLRIDIAANSIASINAQSVVAVAGATQSQDAVSKRVQRLPFHVATQWWRITTLAGGSPLNVWFAAFSPAETAKFYTAAIAATPADKGRTSVELKARADVERIAVRESVRSGGAGSGKFYAARKRGAFARPARIVLTFDDATKVLWSRSEFDERDRLQTKTEFVWNADGLPVSAITLDFNGRPLATWSFTWKTAANFAENLWSLEAPGQIVEDAILRPLAEYRGDDASANFHRGVALARQEEFASALAAFEAANAAAPQAVAPVMAAFEAAVTMRNFDNAALQLNKLGQQLSPQSPEIISRRIRLAAARRDWKQARAALDEIAKAPNAEASAALLLQSANLARALGDSSAAATLLAHIVTQPQTPPNVAAQAALTLSELNARSMVTRIDSNVESAKATSLLLDIAGGKTPAQSTLAAPGTVQSMAAAGIGLERAGQFEAAVGVWNRVGETATEPLWREAQRRLMNLHAQRGDTATSLKAYRALLARLENESDVRELQDALFRTWDKALKRDALRSVLQSRAIATAATDDDMRLWLAWQETYGTDDDIEVTINTSVSRFTGGESRAWWQSRRAEFVADKAASQPPSVNGLAARARYFRDALSAVSAAQESDPTRSYYAVQRALILSRRATLPVPVSDVASRVNDRTAALDALNALERAWPNDPDVQIAIAVQQLALSPGEADAVVRRLQSALEASQSTLNGAGGALGHAGSFTARQLLASTLRRAGKIEAARAEYEKLWAAAGAPSEQLGIALNWLNLLDSQSDAAGATVLAARLVREPRAFSATQDLMSEWANSLLQRKKLAPLVTIALRSGTDAASRLAGAYLDFGAWRLAGRRAAAENAPVATEAALRDATQNWTQSKIALGEVAASTDPVLATQAITLLAQDALARGDKAGAIKLFTAAVALEPTELNLRIAFARALLDEGQRDEALAVRDQMLAAWNHDTQTLRWAAWISLRATQAAPASQLTRRAVDRATSDAEIGATPWQEATILLARALLAQGETTAAGEQYLKLSGEPWTIIDRAAALLDWQARATDANRPEIAEQAASRLRTLKLSAADLQQAQALQRSFE